MRARLFALLSHVDCFLIAFNCIREQPAALVSNCSTLFSAHWWPYSMQAAALTHVSREALDKTGR
jgi:hypothetical protein